MSALPIMPVRGGIRENPNHDVDFNAHKLKNAHSENHENHKHHSGISPEWDLDGIYKSKQSKLLFGVRPYTWTPFPVGMQVAEILRDQLAKLTFEGGNVQDHVHHVGETFRVLHATAGAGGSTITLGTIFRHVHAGDFCAEQLSALRNNIDVIFGNSEHRPTVDDAPVNACDRKDYDDYDAVFLEFCWGGNLYVKARMGTKPMWTYTGEYQDWMFDDITDEKEKAYEEKGVRVYLGPMIRRILGGEDCRVKIVASLVPFNFDFTQLSCDLSEHNICLYCWCPTFPGEHPVRDLDAGDVGPESNILEDDESRKSYKSCKNPDVYLFAYRATTSNHANETWASWMLRDVGNRACMFGPEVKTFVPDYFPWSSQPWWGDAKHRIIPKILPSLVRHARQNASLGTCGVIYLGPEWHVVGHKETRKERDADREARRVENFRNGQDDDDDDDDDNAYFPDRNGQHYELDPDDLDGIRRNGGKKNYRGFSRVSETGNNVFLDENGIETHHDENGNRVYKQSDGSYNVQFVQNQGAKLRAAGVAKRFLGGGGGGGGVLPQDSRVNKNEKITPEGAVILAKAQQKELQKSSSSTSTGEKSHEKNGESSLEAGEPIEKHTKHEGSSKKYRQQDGSTSEPTKKHEKHGESSSKHTTHVHVDESNDDSPAARGPPKWKKPSVPRAERKRVGQWSLEESIKTLLEYTFSVNEVHSCATLMDISKWVEESLGGVDKTFVTKKLVDGIIKAKEMYRVSRRTLGVQDHAEEPNNEAACIILTPQQGTIENLMGFWRYSVECMDWITIDEYNRVCADQMANVAQAGTPESYCQIGDLFTLMLLYTEFRWKAQVPGEKPHVGYSPIEDIKALNIDEKTRDGMLEELNKKIDECSTKLPAFGEISRVAELYRRMGKKVQAAPQGLKQMEKELAKAIFTAEIKYRTDIPEGFGNEFTCMKDSKGHWVKGQLHMLVCIGRDNYDVPSLHQAVPSFEGVVWVDFIKKIPQDFSFKGDREGLAKEWNKNYELRHKNETAKRIAENVKKKQEEKLKKKKQKEDEADALRAEKEERDKKEKEYWRGERNETPAADEAQEDMVFKPREISPEEQDENFGIVDNSIYVARYGDYMYKLNLYPGLAKDPNHDLFRLFREGGDVYEYFRYNLDVDKINLKKADPRKVRKIVKRAEEKARTLPAGKGAFGRNGIVDLKAVAKKYDPQSLFVIDHSPWVQRIGDNGRWLCAVKFKRGLVDKEAENIMIKPLWSTDGTKFESFVYEIDYDWEYLDLSSATVDNVRWFVDQAEIRNSHIAWFVGTGAGAFGKAYPVEKYGHMYHDGDSDDDRVTVPEEFPYVPGAHSQPHLDGDHQRTALPEDEKKEKEQTENWLRKIELNGYVEYNDLDKTIRVRRFYEGTAKSSNDKAIWLWNSNDHVREEFFYTLSEQYISILDPGKKIKGFIQYAKRQNSNIAIIIGKGLGARGKEGVVRVDGPSDTHRPPHTAATSSIRKMDYRGAALSNHNDSGIHIIGGESHHQAGRGGLYGHAEFSSSSTGDGVVFII